MSIIDELKQSQDDYTVAKFESLRRAGYLSEAQIAYGEAIIRRAREAAMTPEDRAAFEEARRMSELVARAKRNAARRPRPVAVAPTFEIGQLVTTGSRTGTVVKIEGTGKNAILIVDIDGEEARLVAKFAKAVAA